MKVRTGKKPEVGGELSVFNEHKQDEVQSDRCQLLPEFRVLASIVMNHPYFIGVGTLDGKALFVNPSGLKMMGLPTEHDVTEMSALDFYPKEDAEKLVNEGIPIALRRGSWTAESNLLKADKTTVPVEQTIGINYDSDGKPDGFNITMRDITKLRQTNKKLEAQLVRVKALSEKTLQQELKRAVLEEENARKTRELEEARKLQLSLLPKEVPKHADLDIAVYMKTASEVGGDYYDFDQADDGTLTVAIGDATGHGLPAGTLVAATKSLFKALARDPEPEEILRKMSKILYSMGFSRMYMAMTMAKFKGDQLRVAAAGMPYAIIYDSETGSVEEVILKGMPLGGFPDFSYESKEFSLRRGDTALFMSDGFPEMFNEQDEMLGEERVKTLFEDVARESPEEIIAHLVKAGKTWADGRTQHDDVTFVVMKIK